MISTNIYLDSLQRVVSELPNILSIWDKIDEYLYEEYIEQFRWLLDARFIFLYKADNLPFYLNKIMNFTHQILSHKEKIFYCMGITEQDIICANF